VIGRPTLKALPFCENKKSIRTRRVGDLIHFRCFKMAKFETGPSQPILSILEMQPFWAPLTNAGFVRLHQVPRTLDPLLQLLSETSARELLQVLESIQQVTSKVL
jgi:hypothetical protein